MKIDNYNEIIELKGDASLRKFFRKRINNSTTIIIKAKMNKKKNLLIYDAINRIFFKNKISVKTI